MSSNKISAVQWWLIRFITCNLLTFSKYLLHHHVIFLEFGKTKWHTYFVFKSTTLYFALVEYLYICQKQIKLREYGQNLNIKRAHFIRWRHTQLGLNTWTRYKQVWNYIWCGMLNYSVKMTYIKSAHISLEHLRQRLTRVKIVSW